MAVVSDLLVQLLLGGVWTDVTSFVSDRQPLVVTHGTSREGSRSDPANATMVLDNTDGRFSPRNPTGAYYGQIGRNTPLRVSVDRGLPYLSVRGTADWISTPDSAALSITGDLDVRAEINLNDWRQLAYPALKFNTAGDQRSWYLAVLSSGHLLFLHSTAGTLATEKSSTSTEKLPWPAKGRMAVRATIDVDNGAAGHTVTFYLADSIAGPWVQLGVPVVKAGITSIFDSTAVLRAGELNGLAGGTEEVGRLHNFELRNGINGTVVANVVMANETVGAASFGDQTGKTWTVVSGAAVTDRSYRFCGEVASWPQRWNATGTDVYTPIEARGITSRLGQNASPEPSALYRGVLKSPGLVGYWPLEDDRDASLIGSAVGGPPMIIVEPHLGVPDFGAYDAFEASAPILTANNARIGGLTKVHTATNTIQVRFLMAVPATGSSDPFVLCRILCGGTLARWDLFYGLGGTLELEGYGPGLGSPTVNPGPSAFNVNGKRLRVSVELAQNGGNVDWTVVTLEVNGPGLTVSGTAAGHTVTACQYVELDPDRAHDEVAFGHVSVQTQITSIYDLAGELWAHKRERAGVRLRRLCADAGVYLVFVGDSDLTPLMGGQEPRPLLELLRECEAVDGGVLSETADRLGLVYRTRESMQAQTVDLVLGYDALDLSRLEPVEDDFRVANDVTVRRRHGSSARAVKTTGPLSTAAPPNGIGVYDSSVELNLFEDDDLEGHASWYLHLGTVDVARVPTVGVDLARNRFMSDMARTDGVLRLGLGDRVQVTDPPDWLAQETIDQLVLGITETVQRFSHTVDVACMPYEPFNVAVLDTAGSRLESDGSTLNEDLTTTETLADVTTPSGPLWSTLAADRPFGIEVGGERMTVTGVTAPTGTVQTLTVTRSVNGVVKTHPPGTPVVLTDRVYIALQNRT